MPHSKPFALNREQETRLLACRAAWDEGEENEERLARLAQREEDDETLRAFARLLEAADFAQGNDLMPAQLADLLALARALAPNPNLDARLLRQPNAPQRLNQDLRDLLYGAGGVPIRLRFFLNRHGAGGQTALQLLCAANPVEWPLVTRQGLRALNLTPEQQTAALETARVRYDLPAPSETSLGLPDNDVILRLLADVVIYQSVRDVLESPDYIQTHRLLTQGLGAGHRRSRSRALAPLHYAPSPKSPAVVRETPDDAYFSPSDVNTEEPAADFAPAPDIGDASEAELLTLLENYVAAQGFTYPPLTVRDYYLSLQSKPFVLLAGLSGTGKTRLTSLFADALTGGKAGQYRLLPARPDWADSTPLLGYVNLLAASSDGKGRFVTTPFLDFLQIAARPENAHRAYFVCLDEMNLARPEHYFAEILSAMETPTRELLLPDGRALRLPPNLFLTGTLNFDEATHGLSRKVLDRANTLVFREVCLSEAEPELPTTAAEMSPALRQAVFLQTRIGGVSAARAKLRRVSPSGSDYAAHILAVLTEANGLLEPRDLHFAYRVRDEILRYCAHAFDRQGNGLLTPDDGEANLRVALDLQIQQKVLPRLSGTREQMETPVRDLHVWAERRGFLGTASRLTRLQSRLERDGFAGWDEG